MHTIDHTTPETPNAQTDNEIWKPVVGYEGRYEISSHGRCRSLDTADTRGRVHKGRFIKPSLTAKGYISYNLSAWPRKLRSCRAHRLVAIAFISNPDNLPEVNHIDTNRTNNHYTNLIWMTRKQNMHHSLKLGHYDDHYRRHSGAGNSCFKGAIQVFDKQGQHVDTLIGVADIEAKGYASGCVSACLNGKRKRHKGMTFVRLPLPNPRQPKPSSKGQCFISSPGLVAKNARERSYPIPRTGTGDFKTLRFMLIGMADECSLRANDLLRDEVSRAKAEATGAAYQFAAMMIDQQLHAP